MNPGFPPSAVAPTVVVVGGGPAGLMAAEAAVAAGARVEVFDALGSVGRKFLLAGKGGLNLTHSERRPAFDRRYRERAADVGRWLDVLDADGVRDWARGLGVDTFVGSSGRVFPLDLKAAPLLRGWVRRLRESGVRFHMHHRFLGWTDDGQARFATPEGERAIAAGALVLALGGASWPRLGSDGAWVPVLEHAGIALRPLAPANCGFDVDWSAHFSERFAGHPVKPVAMAWRDAAGATQRRQGEFVVTATGVEGSLVYAASADLRASIERDGEATVELELAPGRDVVQLTALLAAPRGGRSLSEVLRRRAGIEGVRAGLVHETVDTDTRNDPARLAKAIQALPLRLRRPRPIAEAISTAGGVRLDALAADLMCSARPGVFCAGEMLDWEAPTGGYLLTACLASGRIAGAAAAAFAARHPSGPAHAAVFSPP
jgi:uncharacterized flavoprotein (TIGR03862 family)